MRTVVYVDGFNLYYAIRNTGCKWLDLRSLVANVLPAGHVITTIHYYTARVSGAADPGAPGRQQQYLNALNTIPGVLIHYGTFLAKDVWRPVLNLPVANRELTVGAARVPIPMGTHAVQPEPGNARSNRETLQAGTYPVYGVRRARALPLPDAIKAQVFAMEEKGSDVNLAAHLVNDCCLGNFDAAAVITNDTDLVEPIRIVTQEHGKPVVLLCPAQRGAATPLRRVSTSVRHINRAHLNASLFADPIVLSSGKTIAKPPGW